MKGSKFDDTYNEEWDVWCVILFLMVKKNVIFENKN